MPLLLSTAKVKKNLSLSTWSIQVVTGPGVEQLRWLRPTRSNTAITIYVLSVGGGA